MVPVKLHRADLGVGRFFSPAASNATDALSSQAYKRTRAMRWHCESVILIRSAKSAKLQPAKTTQLHSTKSGKEWQKYTRDQKEQPTESIPQPRPVDPSPKSLPRWRNRRGLHRSAWISQQKPLQPWRTSRDQYNPSCNIL